MKFNDLVKEYGAILEWDGESALELMDHVRKLRNAAPYILSLPLPFIMRLFYHRINLRFDLSRISDEILTVDKHGRAIVKSLGDWHVVQLMTIRPL